MRTVPVAKDVDKTVWKWRGVCKHCLAQGNKTNTITDVVGTSSNFSKHAKKHPVQYKEWETKKSMVFNSPGLKKAAVAVPGQLTLATAFAGIPKTYHKTHPKQVLITSSVVKNLVIGCGIPHYIVENPKFRAFMKDVDSMWDPVSGKWISNVKLPDLESSVKRKLIELLEDLHYCSATLDIWSDRRMRGYMGITVHFLDKTFKLLSKCLGVFRMKGRHSAEAIFDLFHGVMVQYKLHNKVVRVISDNAANMKKAFRVQMVVAGENQESNAVNRGGADFDAADDDDTQLAALEEELSQALAEMFVTGAGSHSYQRMGCFNHALHNTVGDGLKKGSARMSRALAKIQQFCTFAHKSGAFAESLENAFGNEVTLKTEIKTRWNYQFIAAEHFMSLHAETFEKAVDDHGSNKLNAMKLQAVDRECVQDVLNALQDFQEATLRTSADKQPTITHVLPLLLGIINNLQQLLPLSQYAQSIIEELLVSLYKRFNGLLQLVHFKTANAPHFVPAPTVQGETFNDRFYLIAPFLDPTIANNWIDVECIWLSAEQKEHLHFTVKTLITQEMEIIEEVHRLNPPPTLPVQPTVPESVDQATKKPRLLSYKQKAEPPKHSPLKPVQQELHSYLTFEVQNLEPEDFWLRYSCEFPRLSLVARKVLCVVAWGSPIERVFSVAGNILRPRRSRMGAKTLAAIVFLKCNFDMM